MSPATHEVLIYLIKHTGVSIFTSGAYSHLPLKGNGVNYVYF